MIILITIAITAVLSVLALSRRKKQVSAPRPAQPPKSDGYSIEYYGIGATRAEAYESGLPGVLFLDPVTSRYFADPELTYPANGWFVTSWSDSFDGCWFMYLENGYRVTTNNNQ